MSPERGKRMPETREQYERMADLFEKALLREKRINGELRALVNNLRQRIDALERSNQG